MPRRKSNDPFAQSFRIWMDNAQMWNDAAAVIALRSAKIAAGGKAADAETRRMFTEKMDAVAESGIALAFTPWHSAHDLAQLAMPPFAKRARANRKRLSARRRQ